jgi:hypothetical protein
LIDDTAPGPSKHHRPASPSTSPEPEPEIMAVSAKEKTWDVDEFFEKSVTISGKKY